MTPGMLLRVFLLISILGWSVEDDLLPYTTDITLEGLYEGVECKNGTHKYCGEDNAEGPHCKDCLLFLWAKTGCKNDSEKGPTHGKDSVEHWQTKTVRDVIKNMNYYKDPVMARWCHGLPGTLDYTPAVETSEPYNRKLNIFDGKTAGASDVHITPNIPKPEKSTEVGLSSESTVPVTSNDVALKTFTSSRSSHLSVTSSIIVKGSSEGPHLSVTPGGLQIGVTSAEHFAENGKTQNDQREEQSVGRGNVDDPSVYRGFPETAEQRQRAMSTKTILLVCSLVFLVLVILALGIFLYRVWVRRRASSVYNLKRGAPLESKSNGRGPPPKLQVKWAHNENEAEKNEDNCSESELIPIDQLDIYSV